MKKTSYDFYEDDFYAYMDTYINNLVAIGAVFMTISTLTEIYQGKLFTSHFFMNFSSAILFFVMYLFRDKIKSQTKVQVSSGYITIFGIVLYLFSEYELVGILLILTSDIFLALLKKKNEKLLHNGLSIAVILIGIIQRSYGDLEKFVDYLYLIYMYLSLSVLTTVVFNQIKQYLFQNMSDLEDTLMEEKKNVIEIQEKNKLIEHMAYYNPLTDCLNRQRFSELLDEKLAAGEQGTLFYFDINNYTYFNQIHGINAGDTMLRNIADVLKERFGLVSYFGSNNFAFWVKEKVDRRRGSNLNSSIISSINESNTNFIDISNRVVVVPSSEVVNPSFSEMHAIADYGMKYLKNAKLDYYYFDIEEMKKIKEREEERQYIISSIDDKNYEVFYQEKVDSRTDTVVGLEALSRLKKGDRYLNIFNCIRTLEENDMIIPFGILMLEKTFQDYKRIVEKYGNVSVAVNISIKQIADPNFAEKLNFLAKMYQVDPKKIILELTETVLILDFKELEGILVNLKQYGYQIAIDDFGAGYTSLNYIDQLSPDIIKIDKSFVDRILFDDKTKLIVKTIIDIAGRLKLKVIAEGVEQYEQVKALSEIECYIIQGYYYSKPKPME